jgi:hypothetical protein
MSKSVGLTLDHCGICGGGGGGGSGGGGTTAPGRGARARAQGTCDLHHGCQGLI